MIFHKFCRTYLVKLTISHTYLQADDTSIFYQQKDIMEIKNVSNWLLEKKLLIHFDEDKI